MIEPERLATLTASAIGRALVAGEGSPVALVDYLIGRIESEPDNPVFLKVTRERAVAEAEAAEIRLTAGRPLSALDGVPIGWKDLVGMKGEVTTAASALFRDTAPATADAPIVANATAAGMVNLGKLNLTEFAYSALGLNPHFGTPYNPHGGDARRAPGGSSSGSGVAVAKGFVPCAIGTDTGGSIRVPAAFNGVVGYKSSEGRIDKSAVFPLSYTLDTIGPLARSVEDCVQLDAVLRGAVVSTVRRMPLSEARLFVPETLVLDDLEPAVAANFEQSLRNLEAAGVRITRGPLGPLAEAHRLSREIGSITAADAYHFHRDIIDGPDVERVDRRVVARILGGKRMSSVDLIDLHRHRVDLMAELARQLDGALMAMPTTPIVAPEIAPLEADDEVFHRTNLLALRNTMVGNFLNLPGLALPNGSDADGMPTSLLICTTGGDDDRLLGLGLSAERLVRF